ncbi:MAG: hypothetical protein J6112_03110 [Clostridia bacterium]|nr:hypothetical protein [Clostridia bacterium]
MVTYNVKKINKQIPDEADWLAAETAEIGFSPWEKDFPTKYRSTAKLIDTGAHVAVRLESFEKDPVRLVFDDWGEIWTDSCLEFFFMPDPGTGVYCNFECNANGCMLVGKGSSRKPRERVTPRTGSAEFFSIRPEILEDSWRVTYLIPKSFIGDITEPMGNFYKCQEHFPEKAHFQCWSDIKAEKPDFHRPEFFGRIVF